jgi:hypothetical protein
MAHHVSKRTLQALTLLMEEVEQNPDWVAKLKEKLGTLNP